MNVDSFWESQNIAAKLTDVLSRVTYVEPSHHFGRPFVTAYQLAILFKERFPYEVSRLGHPVGGKDSGVKFSLTSYLAGQLSTRIKSGEITDIEGCFLSNRQLIRIEFNDGGETITSSSTDSQYDLSMFRLKDS